MRSLDDLPAPLAAYLRRNLPSIPAEPRAVILHQRGEMRLAPERGWMPFTAEQTIDAARTGFVWHARVKMAPLVTAVVEDAYEDGHGRLDAKVWGLLSVAHGRGPEIDRGEAQRYLAELPWCPQACIHNDALVFEARGDDVVRVWVGDPATHVDLVFDAARDIVESRTTTRARGDEVQPWAGRFFDYRDFGPIRAPARGEVSWHPPEGRFDYWRGEVSSIELA